MKTLFYSLLLASTMGFSQREVPISDFAKIITSDRIDVTLIQAKDGNPRVILNGAGSEDVEVIQKNNELKIRMPLVKLLKGDNVTAIVFYRNDIYHFEANEGSHISSNDNFKGSGLRCIAKEGAEIKLKIDAGKINVKSSSGATVTLSGIAKSQEVVTNTGGIYEGDRLLTEHTEINSNAGGNASVNASQSVDVKILAGGVITVHGGPKKISQKITGGGRVEQVK